LPLFNRRIITAQKLGYLERVETIVRSRFGIVEEALVLVSEETSTLPGAPGNMTTILFWTASATRHRVRIFKPVSDVTEADLPASWLRGALVDEGDPDCC
jgi:hypothetical protein